MSSLLSLGCYTLIMLSAAGAARAEQAQDRARQLEYDPKTGQWTQSEPPVPDTPLGDLQLARQAFARGKYGPAYRRIKKWLETYGPEDGKRWLVYWRLFFLICAEVWNLGQGREYLVSHYLFEKPRGGC